MSANSTYNIIERAGLGSDGAGSGTKALKCIKGNRLTMGGVTKPPPKQKVRAIRVGAKTVGDD